MSDGLVDFVDFVDKQIHLALNGFAHGGVHCGGVGVAVVLDPVVGLGTTVHCLDGTTVVGVEEAFLLEESVLNVSVFDEDGRFRAQGGFTKINKVFGNQLENIILELNEYLYEDGGETA